MCYPMGVFWAHTRPSFICTHDSSCHVSQLPLATNFSLYSMSSFHEKPRAMNLALYPTMFPSTASWTYELSFMYRYYILDIILLQLVFHFFLVTSSWLEGFVSMMFLYSTYYSLSLNYSHLFFRISLHSSLLVGNYVCGLSYKSNAVVWLETFHKVYS